MTSTNVVLILALILAPAACGSSTAAPPEPPRLAPVVPTEALAMPMAKLRMLHGVWRGQATGTTPSGERYTVTQTERVGPMLGGDILVIEGRGYKPDGTTGFNAFGVVSWNPTRQTYELRSYAQGRAGTFDLALTEDGYVWSVPAGPQAIMRFTAKVTGDQWRETGEYVAADQPPVPAFEMNLTRVGDTGWPLGTPLPPR